MLKWLSELDRLLNHQQTLVLVTVAAVKGSTPREPGAKMLVTKDQTFSTIGGGHLEYKAIQIAVNMLSHPQQNRLQRFSLGAGLGQCCGGVVTLLFECIQQRPGWVDQLIEYQTQGHPCMQVIPVSDANQQARFIVGESSLVSSAIDGLAQQLLLSKQQCQISALADNEGGNQQYVFDPVTANEMQVYVFGAGHVGRALVENLCLQELCITWVDTRDQQIPETLAENVVSCCTDTPEAVIEQAAAGAYFVVMTHDHQLDQHLCEHILKRDDFSYLGLIGSLSKRKKFEHRLTRRGISSSALKRMTCPIGISGISSKKPAAIGLAVSAQIIQRHQQLQQGLFVSEEQFQISQELINR